MPSRREVLLGAVAIGIGAGLASDKSGSKVPPEPTMPVQKPTFHFEFGRIPGREPRPEKPDTSTIHLSSEIPYLSPEVFKRATDALRLIHTGDNKLFNGVFLRSTEEGTNPFMLTRRGSLRPTEPYFVSGEQGSTQILRGVQSRERGLINLTKLDPSGEDPLTAMLLPHATSLEAGSVCHMVSLVDSNTSHAIGGQVIGASNGEAWFVVPPQTDDPKKESERVMAFFENYMPGGVVLNTEGQPAGIVTNAANRGDVSTLAPDFKISLQLNGKPLPHVPAAMVGFVPITKGIEQKFR